MDSRNISSCINASITGDSSFEMSSIIEPALDIGEHFMELLKLSNVPEHLFPDPDYIRNFFSQDEGTKDFASFLMTLGPQNFVTPDQVARYEENISQGITDEEVDKYLLEKLGDQSNLIPISSGIIDSHEAKLKQKVEEYKQLEEINTTLKSELKGQNEKLKNLNKAITATEKGIEDKLKGIQTLSQSIKKKSESFLSMNKDDSGVLEVDKEVDSVKEVLQIEAQIYDIINEILSTLIEGKKKQSEFLKNILLSVSRVPEKTDKNILEKFKELQYDKIEKITKNLMDLITKLNSVNKFISALHESRHLHHMSVVLGNLVHELTKVNGKVQDILSMRPDAEKIDVDGNIGKLNSILNNSSSASKEKLLESLEKLGIDENPIEEGMKNLTSTLIDSIHGLEAYLTDRDVDSELLKEFLKNKETTEKLFEEFENTTIKERSPNQELFLSMITDPETFLSKLEEIEEKVKLFEKAMSY